MAIKKITLLILSLLLLQFIKAQRKADSALAVKTFQLLLAACKKADITSTREKATDGFFRAAPYIAYRGSDKKRAWKTFANYRKAEDKQAVDEVCTRINETVNRDSSYRIVKYLTQKESEGDWHVLMVQYNDSGVERGAIFAFLKIGKRLGLGDID
jgi:hypothetical protein